MFLMAMPVVVNAVTIDNPLKYGDIPSILKAITSLLVKIAIPLGTIMIIISGIQYMTAGGNEEKVTKAKKTIFYTIIGVAIVIAANFIMDLIKEILGKID